MIKPENISVNKNDLLCVFGSGIAGSAMYSFLKTSGYTNLIIADNDVTKHRVENDFVITSVADVERRFPKCYLIGFVNNNREKIASVRRDLIDHAIDDNRICVIDISEEWLTKFSIIYTEKKIEEMRSSLKDAKSNPEKIIFIANGYHKEDTSLVGGGARGALNMQRTYLNDIQGYKTDFFIHPETPETKWEEWFNRFQYLLDEIEMLRIVSDNENVLWVSNEIKTAYALFALRQRYVLVIHSQGDYVSDQEVFGRTLSEREEKYFTDIQKKVIEYSVSTRFPSKGARQHFLNTIAKPVKIKSTQPLYNTIYDYPKNVKNAKESIRRKDEVLSVLSIGQMTKLKGMDLIPLFLERLMRIIKQKIRWIVVASGQLEEHILATIEEVNDRAKDSELIIEYIRFSNDQNHQEIYRLMQNSDLYLMLQRVAIFDFSTLEAMYMGLPVILSDIPGNDEFNMDDNILLVNESTSDENIGEYIENRMKYGKKNREVYDKYFSATPFKKRYVDMLDDITKSYR